MAYIGKQPLVGNFVKLDAITTSATTTFNLTNGGVAYYPQSANNCLVSLNGILQAPTDSYTISGSTIVFSSALTTSDVIDFIIVLGDVLNIGTPSDNTVSLAKLTATGTKNSTTFLRGDNTFAVPAGGVNTPAFRATMSASQSVTAGTLTKVAFNTETFDTDSCYDTTLYRFTPTTAGKYFVYLGIYYDHGGGNPTSYYTLIYKNGSAFESTYQGQIGTDIGQYGSGITVNSIVTMNGSTDYIEAYGRQIGTTSATFGSINTFFGAYRLIGV